MSPSSWREIRRWGRWCSPAFFPVRAPPFVQRGRTGRRAPPAPPLGSPQIPRYQEFGVSGPEGTAQTENPTPPHGSAHGHTLKRNGKPIRQRGKRSDVATLGTRDDFRRRLRLGRRSVFQRARLRRPQRCFRQRHGSVSRGDSSCQSCRRRHGLRPGGQLRHRTHRAGEQPGAVHRRRGHGPVPGHQAAFRARKTARCRRAHARPADRRPQSGKRDHHRARNADLRQCGMDEAHAARGRWRRRSGQRQRAELGAPAAIAGSENTRLAGGLPESGAGVAAVVRAHHG